MTQIDQGTFTLGYNNFFNTKNLLALHQDLHKYYIDAIKIQQPRDDYFKLLKLCQIFLGKARKNWSLISCTMSLASSSLDDEGNLLPKMYMFQPFLLQQRKMASLK